MKFISLPRLAGIFLRIGNLTFGGGDPATAALYGELVAARRWLSREKYGLTFALARVTPGTNMLAVCAGAAWELAGWSGAALAGLLAGILGTPRQRRRSCRRRVRFPFAAAESSTA